MKTMTCSQMGGPCDSAMTAGTEEEMVAAGWQHVGESHPEIMEGMKNLPKEDMDKWAADFHTKWEAQPEDAPAA